MNTTTRISAAERLGRSLGRGWRAYVHGEQQASDWLVSKGLPMAGATLLLWVVKLVVLGILLYTAFWAALLLVLTFAAGWATRNTDWDEPRPEWRYGHAGYGLYRGDLRIDLGDPYEDE